MPLYDALTFTAITIDDFEHGGSLPANCDICKSGEAPFMRYELRSPPTRLELGPREEGFCCKKCVPRLVLQIVQCTERNIEIATNRPNDFDYQDELLERECDTSELTGIREYEKDMATLALKAMTPAFLLFRVKSNHSSKCKQCGSTPLLKYLWHHQKLNALATCCPQCAFNFCGTILAASIDNEAEAERLMKKEAEEEERLAEEEEQEDVRGRKG
jgi:hypothetical protein